MTPEKHKMKSIEMLERVTAAWDNLTAKVIDPNEAIAHAAFARIYVNTAIAKIKYAEARKVSPKIAFLDEDE